MKARNQGTNFKAVKLPKSQQTVARCYSLIHIGTIPNVFRGQENGKFNRIFVTWELPKLKAVFNEELGEQPFAISKELTLSTNEKSNLAKLVQEWRGRPFSAEEQDGFDPTVMVGRPAVITFYTKEKKDSGYKEGDPITNRTHRLVLNGIAPKMKEIQCPPMINEKFIWDWEEVLSGNEFPMENYKQIPSFLREKMKQSEEYEEAVRKFGFDPESSLESNSSHQEGSGGGSEDDYAESSDEAEGSW